MADDGTTAVSQTPELRRTRLVVERFPYLLLGVATCIALATNEAVESVAGPITTLALAAVTAGWIAFWVNLHPGWRTHPRLMLAYYLGRWALTCALALINPFFAIFAFVGYLDCYDLLGRRRGWLGVPLTAVIMAYAQIGGIWPSDGQTWGIYAALLAFNIAISTMLMRLAVADLDLSQSRARSITELEGTNAALGRALADNAGLQAQLLVQAREAGMLDERQRLAGEIHDTIAQGLTGIITQLQAADQSTDPATASRHREQALSLARASLAEARRSVHDLRPEALEHQRLPAALRAVVTSWSESAGVSAELTTTGEVVDVHDEVEATLLRIAQESLTNVAKHARARRVGVTLSYMGDEVTLDVRDDGVGFDHRQLPVQGPGSGVGLDVMRQRAARVAGVVEVESEPGGGTAVSARVPSVPARTLDRPEVQHA